MIIKYYDGNVVDSTAPIIAHQVNFEGIMGAGVAKNIREKYPDIMKDYQEFCKDYYGRLGSVHFYKRGEDSKGNPLYIANCFSQRINSENGCLTDYDSFAFCMLYLRDTMIENNIEHRIAMPYKIGCGISGGDWKEIWWRIEYSFGEEFAQDFVVELWNINKYTEEERKELPTECYYKRPLNTPYNIPRSTED